MFKWNFNLCLLILVLLLGTPEQDVALSSLLAPIICHLHIDKISLELSLLWDKQSHLSVSPGTHNALSPQSSQWLFTGLCVVCPDLFVYDVQIFLVLGTHHWAQHSRYVSLVLRGGGSPCLTCWQQS